MNIYRWVHLDSAGWKKDGPLTIVAKNIDRAKELLADYIRGMTFCEGDTTSLEYFGVARRNIESVTDYNPDWD